MPKSKPALKVLPLYAIGSLVAVFFVNTSAWGKEPSHYQLGRGYEIGDTGVHLGGYASIHAQGLGQAPWSFEASDVSLFVSWDNGAKLRFFSETEVENLFVVGEDQRSATKNTNLLLERLYLDYLISDQLTVRIGKMLTPIGQWNVIHADPLVWTTTRPVATTNLFSGHLSGIMLHGTVPMGEQSLDYSLYGDYSSTLDPGRTEQPYFDHAVGARLRYNMNENLKIGLSYADFSLEGSSSVRNHLLGLDAAWIYNRLVMTSEIVYRNNNTRTNKNAWQGYVQGVVSLTGPLYGVGRYEFFDQANGQFGQVGVLGLAYRPKPPVIWKLEYLLGEHNHDLAPNGLFASFSVLF